MKAWVIGLTLALGLAGCQGNQTNRTPEGGGGGAAPKVAPSPAHAPANPELRSGPTGGVGDVSGGGSMGGMDPDGIGPGTAGGGGGNPQVVPKGGQPGGEDANVAPRNDPSRMKR